MGKFTNGKLAGSAINPFLISNGPGDPNPIAFILDLSISFITYLILSFKKMNYSVKNSSLSFNILSSLCI